MQRYVRLYTLSTCIHCKATKALLDSHTVQYDFIDVDLIPLSERDAVLAEVRKYNPACSFPTILIGDQIIVGFDKQALIAALDLR
ncbi:MAG: glutaredoxin family protein [Nitrospirota bacterium]